MTGYQFAHVEMYARSVSKLAGSRRAQAGEKRGRGTGGWTARQVLAEALRETGACPHVQQPIPPQELFGDLRKLANRLDELERDPPKGQRKDTPVLMAGVLSAPWSPQSPEATAWRMDAVAWLHDQWGERLQAVIAHDDESHDHLHWYVTAPHLASVKGLHPGAAARAKAVSEGASAKEQKAAYTKAMSAWQDSYHAAVAEPHGMARLGPARRRLTRAAWLDEQRQAEALANTEAKAKQLNKKAHEFIKRMRDRERKVWTDEREIQAHRAQLDAERKRLADLAAALTPEQENRAADRFAKLQATPPPASLEKPLVEGFDEVVSTQQTERTKQTKRMKP